MFKTYLDATYCSAPTVNAHRAIGGLDRATSSADLEPILPSDSHLVQCADAAVQASSAEVAQ
ncbi:hypothetical protein BWR11_23420 [Pseudomonas aeruginosa]|jgi:hypothetical protein|nr:hypothetical protein BWR11_23420 [Pseudomonas aeruginosa]DAL14745.1 MAG TPA_asm: hypothetical protein [Caudoviricetes sp.]KSI16312.1 hypothetical protein AO981_06050 [Pseudomonas aeruginosa]KSI37627.1 hypothetical protein AO982_05265 [Pseudomonas aeruginosa]KSL96944.1 hypothetical protein APA57_25110 [Pseudomonas aeruginosa]